MSRSVYFLGAALCLGFLMSGCVSQSKYLEVQEQKKFYESAYTNIDSLEAENERLKQEARDNNTFMKQSFQEVEKLTVANQSLMRSYQALKKRYEQIAQSNNSVVSNTSFEKQNLQERLAAKEAELDEKEAYLIDLEKKLAVREQQLNQMRAGMNNARGPSNNYASNSQELNNQIMIVNNQLQQLRTAVTQALYGTPANELTVTQEAGKIYLSLSKNLLFPENSNDQITFRARSLISQLAQALQANPNTKVQIVGNTDSQGDPSYNWERSVIRAATLAKELVALNVNPARITASGRSSFNPKQNNSSAQGRLANNRTEIILSPDYSSILKMIQP